MARRVDNLARDSLNEHAARIFRDCAALLREQKANPFRVNAYLRAAQTLESLEPDVRDILRDEGQEGLKSLPGIGRGLAAAIEEIVRTGRLLQLDRLHGAADPETVFRSVPGIGPALARAIHDELGVDTLEALEVVAHDGRLSAVDGIGPRRAAAIRANLAAILGRAPGARRRPDSQPPVALLLAVDREYREKANAGELPMIAPRRFNPERAAWLPILHTEHQGWHFTALYSNTARAHELDKTDDWVVLYYYDGDDTEGQCTVVTETHGALEGRRVVRGREAECRRAADPPSIRH